ncbi:hypothetical protein [Nocardioides sp. Root140]|uniref:hypothetical protein n=1 Tax=Nocardioides sp. Root140 TaxID=1736460 RepID=UPI0006F3888E|nr:hypothetical protein [Nocardioides sp. Root140]KQY56416.1 hypothetical protein ASD30_08705 [Nocardioides sp. Root140]KRF13851.1 hypothetical protein ASG90_13595 [Nocardioides sp. Soil797]
MNIKSIERHDEDAEEAEVDVDPTEDIESTEDEESPAPVIRRPGSSRRTVLVALFVVLVAATCAGFATLQTSRAADVSQARNEALAAAKSRVPVLLSYENATIDRDLEAAIGQTTGDFHGDYQKILDDVVRPAATDRKISTSASVSGAGVVSASADEVVVLVFLTQKTVTGNGGAGRTSVTGSRVEVTMSPAGAEWKIAGLRPL